MREPIGSWSLRGGLSASELNAVNADAAIHATVGVGTSIEQPRIWFAARLSGARNDAESAGAVHFAA